MYALQIKKDSDERVNDVDHQSQMRVAETASSGEDENSDDDADMDVSIKNISVNMHRNVTIVDSEEVSRSSKKFAVQESDLPEVSHYEHLFLLFMLLKFFGYSLCFMDHLLIYSSLICR